MSDSDSDRLDSWKEIADFVGCHWRTAMRHAEKRGMPVYRLPGDKRSKVYASKAEIDRWIKARTSGEPLGEQAPLDPTPNHAPSPKRNSKGWVWAISAAALIIFLAWTSRIARPVAAPFQPRVVSYVPLTNNGTLKSHIRFGGERIYFNERVGSQQVVAAIHAKGGPIQRTTSPFTNANLHDVSRDGRHLLLTPVEGAKYDSPLWDVPTNGERPRRVGSVMCHAAAWSPDGYQIVFSQGTAVFIAESNGTSITRVAKLEGEVSHLRWAPDGQYIRFTVYDALSSSWTSWQVVVGGSQRASAARLMQLSLSDNCCESWGWSKGGNFFLGGIHKGPDDLQVWIVAEDSKHTPLGGPQALSVPRGSAAIAEFTTGETEASVFALGAGAKIAEFLRFDPRTKQFTVYLPGVSGYDPAASADAKWVAYVKSGHRSLWRIRADGRDESVQLTSDEFEDVELPRWSPDGRQIAFLGKKLGAPFRIYGVASTGGVSKEISVGDENQGAPTWSPDGRKLAYANVACQQTHTCAVHLIELSTRQITTLPESAGLRTARWSPDGRYIAALDPEQHKLVLFEFRTQHWRTLANAVTGDDISWSRDSRFIYFIDPRGEKPVVNRVQIGSGAVQNMARLDVFNQMAGAFDIWFELGPDDTLIFCHMLDSSEVYALNWNR